MIESLREARKKVGYTQADMGRMMGLTMAGYRQKENGIRRLTIEEAKRIALILNMSLDDIFLSVNPSKRLKGVKTHE